MLATARPSCISKVSTVILSQLGLYSLKAVATEARKATANQSVKEATPSESQNVVRHSTDVSKIHYGTRRLNSKPAANFHQTSFQSLPKASCTTAAAAVGSPSKAAQRLGKAYNNLGLMRAPCARQNDAVVSRVVRAATTPLQHWKCVL